MRPVTLVVLVLAASVVAPAALASGHLSEAEVTRRADAIASQLRCPVCQNLSVKDSPSSVAAAFHARVRELVRAGRSDQQIKAFFVARYGDWILLSPPRRGIALAVWLAPLLVLLIGALVVFTAVRRWTRHGRELDRAAAVDPDAFAEAQRRRSALERGETAP